MNSMIRCSTLLVAALCVAVLAGCNAVESVSTEPTAPQPATTAVLSGKIENLGTRRPLVLTLMYDNREIKLCTVPDPTPTNSGNTKPVECKLYGILDQQYSNFNFGSLPVGKGYTISVKTQPFAKTCTVQNPSGVLQPDNPQVTIKCVDNSVPHYTVTANIAAAVASKPGLKLTLTTENGTCPVDVNGALSIVFSPDKCPSTPTAYHQSATFLLDNGTNLPNFTWRVTATVPGATIVDPPTNCFVTGGPVTNTGGNVADDGTAAAGNIPKANQTVTVSACDFAVNVQADYSLSSAETVVPTIAAGDDIKVVLRSQPWGLDVAVVKIPDFTTANRAFKVPDANGDPTATDYGAKSDPKAYYEAVVTKSPAGMTCVLGSSGNSGGASNSNTRTVGLQTDGGAVLLRFPSSSTVRYKWIINKVVRCRRIAANPIPLRGAYWQFRKTTTIATTAGVAVTTVTTVRSRNVLTFFEDGQYLFGDHSASATTSGVEQGFYLYSPTALTKPCQVSGGTTNQPANSICFVAFTDINGAGATGLDGLHAKGNASDYPVPRQLTNVVRSTYQVTPGVSRKTITGTFTDTTSGGVALVAAGTDPASLTVAVNNGSPIDVAAGTYTTVATLVTAINNASNPGAVTGGPAPASAVGNEIRITGPTGGVVLTGPAVATLGLPASVAQGQVAVSTNVANLLATSTRTLVELVLEEVGADPMTTDSNLLDGAWVAWDWQVRPGQPAPVLDQRRVVVYQHGLYSLLHLGMNGIPNLQEACYTGAVADLTGFLSRQRGSGGNPTTDACHLRQITLRNGETLQQVLDVQKTLTGLNAGCPAADTVLTPLTSSCIRLTTGSSDIPGSTASLGAAAIDDPDYPARFPQSKAPDVDARPYSYVEYEVRPANSVPADPVCPTVDKVTYWDTQNSLRKDLLNPPVPRLVLCRLTAN